jgi:hypothetical protein
MEVDECCALRRIGATAIEIEQISPARRAIADVRDPLDTVATEGDRREQDAAEGRPTTDPSTELGVHVVPPAGPEACVQSALYRWACPQRALAEDHQPHRREDGEPEPDPEDKRASATLGDRQGLANRSALQAVCSAGATNDVGSPNELWGGASTRRCPAAPAISPPDLLADHQSPHASACRLRAMVGITRDQRTAQWRAKDDSARPRPGRGGCRLARLSPRPARKLGPQPRGHARGPDQALRALASRPRDRPRLRRESGAALQPLRAQRSEDARDRPGARAHRVASVIDHLAYQPRRATQPSPWKQKTPRLRGFYEIRQVADFVVE